MAKRSHITDADQELFRRAAGDVRRIEDDRAHPQRNRRASRTRDRANEEPSKGLRGLVESEWAPDVGPGDILSFTRRGVQRREAERLRRGRYTIEADLDLHGRTVTDASAALGRFLEDSRRRGLRCVRIAHGKGFGSPSGQPIMKAQVDRRLRHRSEVLAFCSATPPDGDTGALHMIRHPVEHRAHPDRHPVRRKLRLKPPGAVRGREDGLLERPPDLAPVDVERGDEFDIGRLEAPALLVHEPGFGGGVPPRNRFPARANSRNFRHRRLRPRYFPRLCGSRAASAPPGSPNFLARGGGVGVEPGVLPPNTAGHQRPGSQESCSVRRIQPRRRAPDQSGFRRPRAIGVSWREWRRGHRERTDVRPDPGFGPWVLELGSVRG